VFAHERNGDRAVLKVVRDGKATYRGQIVVMANSEIKEIADLKGKRVAFTEQASTSGYMYPRALLAANGVDADSDLDEVIFAKSHDAAVVALLNGSADAACCFDDARLNAEKMGFSDIMKTTRILAYTPEIPADNVTLYSQLDAELSATIVDGLIKVAADPQGAQILMDLYEVEGLVPATDSDYDPVRQMAQSLGLDLEQKIAELN
jgi:phosphonate transport system substrate-binding protein